MNIATYTQTYRNNRNGWVGTELDRIELWSNLMQYVEKAAKRGVCYTVGMQWHVHTGEGTYRPITYNYVELLAMWGEGVVNRIILRCYIYIIGDIVVKWSRIYR